MNPTLRDSLLAAELERRLKLDLAAGDPGDFWAARKRGGPVHFWRVPRDHRGNPFIIEVYQPLCRSSGVAFTVERYRIGRERDPRTVKKLCVECQCRFVEL